MNKPNQSVRYVARELIARLYDSWEEAIPMDISTFFDTRGSGVLVSIQSYHFTFMVAFKGTGCDKSHIKWNYFTPNDEMESGTKDISENLTSKEILEMCMETIDMVRDVFRNTRIRK